MWSWQRVWPFCILVLVLITTAYCKMTIAHRKLAVFAGSFQHFQKISCITPTPFLEIQDLATKDDR